MNWLIVVFLIIALTVLLLRVRSARGQQCKSLACEVETKRPVPVMMPYSWDVPIVNPNYKYF